MNILYVNRNEYDTHYNLLMSDQDIVYRLSLTNLTQIDAIPHTQQIASLDHRSRYVTGQIRQYRTEENQVLTTDEVSEIRKSFIDDFKKIVNIAKKNLVFLDYSDFDSL